MENVNKILVFTLEELSFALPLLSVVRVIHAIEVRKLPKAPGIISGIINVSGKIIPVADIRKRLGLKSRDAVPDHRLIIADNGKREIAIPVDSVTGIQDLNSTILNEAKSALPYSDSFSGVAKIEDDLVLIYDLSSFLNLEEEKELKAAIIKEYHES